MHPYGIDGNERRTVFIFLVPISFLITELSKTIGSWLHWSLPEWSEWIADPASSIFWFLLLGYVMDAYIWRWAPLHTLGLIRTPNLNGDWEGSLSSSWHNFDPDKTMDFTAKIRQDWSQLQVELHFPGSSDSTTKTASILTKRTDPLLVYTYTNDPKPGTTETMATHYGTSELTFDPVRNLLDGRYYNGRGRGNHGPMCMSRLNAENHINSEQRH